MPTRTAPRTAAGTKPRKGKEAAPPLILLVDDFADNREIYAEYLRFSGLRVAEATNGREAIEQARALRPNLVVMDLALPGIDGWGATRSLKADPRTRGIPVIALTGHTLEDYSRRAIEAGCERVVMKPCLPEALYEAIRGALDKSRPAKAR